VACGAQSGELFRDHAFSAHLGWIPSPMPEAFMRWTRACSTLVLSLVVACARTSTGDESTLNDAAKQAAQKRLDDYIAVALADKQDHFADYWTEGAKMFEPELRLDGRDAMMAMIAEVMKSLKFTAATIKVDESYAHDRGTVVYQYGTIDETLTPRDGKTPPTRARFSWTIRWVKGADGVWRMDRFMETPMPPLPASTQAPASK
jgi:ketosteroid isomerase-like protein